MASYKIVLNLKGNAVKQVEKLANQLERAQRASEGLSRNLGSIGRRNLGGVSDSASGGVARARRGLMSWETTLSSSSGLGSTLTLKGLLGAKIGAPERDVCLFVGDGGLQMNLQELGTIMEQQAPVKMILMNNNYLGNVRQWQAMFFGGRYSFTPMMNPDYMQIAAAYNIPSRRVMKREELADAIQEMLATDGPFLLEACIMEEGNVLPMTPPGGSVNQMLLEC